MEEQWKDISGYEGLYQISSCGRVRSIPRRGTFKEVHIRALCNDGHGYLQVTLCKNKKQKTHHIHRLVANAFLDNPNNLREINHKDENKKNNNVNNLEWCTRTYNVNYGERTRKTSKPVIAIKGNTSIKFYGMREAARQLGIGVNNISRAVKRNGKSGGYRWKEVTDV